MDWNAKTWKPILDAYSGKATPEGKVDARLRALEDEADAERTLRRDLNGSVQRLEQTVNAQGVKLQRSMDFGDGLAEAAGRDRQLILDLRKLFDAAQEGRADIVSRVELAQDTAGHNRVRINGLEESLKHLEAKFDPAQEGRADIVRRVGAVEDGLAKARGVGDSNAARLTGLQQAKSKLHEAVEAVERKVEDYDRLKGAVESLQTDVRRLNAKVNAVLEAMPRADVTTRSEAAKANGEARSVTDTHLLPFGETHRCIIRKVDRSPGRTMRRRELGDWISKTLGYKRAGAHIPIAALVKRGVFDEEDKRKSTSRVTLRDPSSWTPGVR